MIRVVLPYHLRLLAGTGEEVMLETGEAATLGAVLDALEARYPALRGVIRDYSAGARRPLLRFYACRRDLSHDAPGNPLPPSVCAGAEPLLIIGAISGG